MYMIYGAPMDVAFWLSQSSLFRRCSFIYGLKEDWCCLIQQILLLTSYFPNRYIIQLEFCHSKIRAVIIPKKKPSRTNPEVGACDNRCEVTTPYSMQT